MEQEADSIGVGQTLVADVSIHTDSIGGGFEMEDLTRGGQRVTTMNNTTSAESGTLTDADNNWGNNTESDLQHGLRADAHYGAAETWDYYQTPGVATGSATTAWGRASRVHYKRLTTTTRSGTTPASA